MKRRKLDPNKIYAFIGRAVVYISFNLLLSAFGYWGFLQRINILGGENGSDNITYYNWDFMLSCLL